MYRFLVTAASAALILIATGATAQVKSSQSDPSKVTASDAEIERVLEEANRIRQYKGTAQRVISNPAETKVTEVQPNSTHSTQISTHIVKKGDTLYNLSKRYNLEIAEIQAANNDVSGNAIEIGQSLKIPLKTKILSLEASTPDTVVVENETSVSDTNIKRVVLPVKVETNTIYAVLPKDTLYGISKRSCVKVEALVSANELSKPNALKPGQKLIMPEGHCLNR